MTTRPSLSVPRPQRTTSRGTHRQAGARPSESPRGWCVGRGSSPQLARHACAPPQHAPTPATTSHTDTYRLRAAPRRAVCGWRQWRPRVHCRRVTPVGGRRVGVRVGKHGPHRGRGGVPKGVPLECNSRHDGRHGHPRTTGTSSGWRPAPLTASKRARQQRGKVPVGRAQRQWCRLRQRGQPGHFPVELPQCRPCDRPAIVASSTRGGASNAP